MDVAEDFNSQNHVVSKAQRGMLVKPLIMFHVCNYAYLELVSDTHTYNL